MQKNGPPNFPRKKVSILIGNIDFFAYSIFKKSKIFIGLRSCSNFDCYAKSMVGLTFLEKKLVFQSEISTFSLILFSKL